MLRALFGIATPPQPAHRVYAIGDVQGCALTLNSLLNSLDKDIAIHRERNGTATIVLAADYGDRGFDAYGVIERLCRLKKRQDVESVFLQGNHDGYFKNFLKPSSARDTARHLFDILTNGGLQTLASYGVDAIQAYKASQEIYESRKAQKRGISVSKDRETALWKIFTEEAQRIKLDTMRAVPPHHRQFFDELEISYQRDDLFICHAGIEPDKKLDEQQECILTGMDDHLIGEDGLTPSRRFARDRKIGNAGKTIVYGHSITSPSEVERLIGKKGPVAIPIDTGACMGGFLTAAVIENGTLVKVISQRALEPAYDRHTLPQISDRKPAAVAADSQVLAHT